MVEPITKSAIESQRQETNFDSACQNTQASCSLVDLEVIPESGTHSFKNYQQSMCAFFDIGPYNKKELAIQE
uniref:Uncharacterized protein n=1 Tax=Timema poppense TaxID=170557 RepID=A0A7R9DP77_TIMPO|nr:unnamed protein product [Timema poppensis]